MTSTAKRNLIESLVQQKKFHKLYRVGGYNSKTFAFVWGKIGIVWDPIKHLKSHAMALGFRFQTDMSWIFQMRYWKFNLVKGLQKISEGKLEVKRNWPIWPDLTLTSLRLAKLADLFLPPTLTSIVLAALWPKWMFSTLF